MPDDSGRRYKGMLNIGVRPTFGGNNRQTSIETHIIGWTNPRPLYDSVITVIPRFFIRKERHFNDINQLRNQLETDKQHVMNLDY